MVNATVTDLQRKNDAAWEALGRTLAGMETYLEPESTPVALLERFEAGDPPLVEITPGAVTVTPERQRMTLADLLGALDGQRRDVFGYLATLGDAELARRARIPIFGPLLGTDEVPLQLGKIRLAAGMPESTYTTPTTGATR